jgi:biotin-(acetyl-CoA carboxylase) ligase
VNVNHDTDDFSAALRSRAGSLKLLTGIEWPLPCGRELLAASMSRWLKKLADNNRSSIIRRARELSRSFLGQTISFHHQGTFLKGIFSGIAPDGGLWLSLAGAEKKIFYSGELD